MVPSKPIPHLTSRALHLSSHAVHGTFSTNRTSSSRVISQTPATSKGTSVPCTFYLDGPCLPPSRFPHPQVQGTSRLPKLSTFTILPPIQSGHPPKKCHAPSSSPPKSTFNLQPSFPFVSFEPLWFPLPNCFFTFLRNKSRSV
jgi:hypothetical protein